MSDRKKHCPQCDWHHYGNDDVCNHCQNRKSSKCQVVLTFDSEDEKNRFMGQLSDGWGENYVHLKRTEDDFYACKEFHVKNLDEDYEEIFDDFDEDTE